MNLKSINKMNVLLKCVPLFILLVLSTNHIHAMYPKVSLEEVAQTADMIFIGTAVSQDTYFNEQRTAIFTNVFLTTFQWFTASPMHSRKALALSP